MCEVHGMSDCSKGGKKVKVLREKDVNEETEEETEELDEVWIVTYGGDRVKQHKNQKEALKHAREVGGKVSATHGAKGVKASVALAKTEKPSKMRRPWDVKEATTERRDSNIKTTDGYTGGNAVGGYKKPDPFDWDDGKRDSSIRTTDDITGGNAKVTSAKDYEDDEDEFKPKNINGVTVRSIFKNKAEKDEHERATKASMDPEGTTQKFLRGLKDKEEKERSDKEDKFLDTVGASDKTKKMYKSASPEGKLAALDAMKKHKIADPVSGKVITTKKDEDDEDDVKLPDIWGDIANKAKKLNSITKPKAVNEVLSKKASAGEWIKDFQDSDNPKFAGKSKEKRKQMALAAYYAKQRNEETELEEGVVDVYAHERDDNSNKLQHWSKAKLDKHRKIPHGTHSRADIEDEHKRRIRTSEYEMRSKSPVKEEAEELEELSKKTLVNYIDKAVRDKRRTDRAHGYESNKPLSTSAAGRNEFGIKQLGKASDKRAKGINMAAQKLAKEEVEQTDESLVQPLLGSVTGSKKKKTAKEQTGPDTPMTFPNMSVDVNTGHNV